MKSKIFINIEMYYTFDIRYKMATPLPIYLKVKKKTHLRAVHNIQRLPSKMFDGQNHVYNSVPSTNFLANRVGKRFFLYSSRFSTRKPMRHFSCYFIHIASQKCNVHRIMLKRVSFVEVSKTS